jgi:hypothetical protein
MEIHPRKIGLSKAKTERIIKHAMASNRFYEPEPGMVAHTANSITPVKNPRLKVWIVALREDLQPAMLRLEEACGKLGDSGLINETVFSLALGKSADDTFWSVLANDGEGERKGWRTERFGISMGVIRNQKPSPQSPVSVMFDWGRFREGCSR